MGNVFGNAMMLGIAIGILVAIVVIVVYGSLRSRFCQFLSRFSIGSPLYPGKRDALQNNEMYNLLFEFRALANADRAYVFRFHNGTEFLPSHSVWKLSCTHEIVRPGVTFEAAKLQGIMFSMLPNIVGPIITGTSEANGVTIYDCKCDNKQKCLKENKRVVVVNVDDMAGSFCRFHLESQNIKTAILCGLVIDGNVIGLVGVDFCGARLPPEKVAELVQPICRTTEIIRFCLQFKKRPIHLSGSIGRSVL